MKHLFLFAAIISEVIGDTATKQSNGFTKLIPSVIAILGVAGAYCLLSLSLKQGMSLGVANGIWAALGIILVAVIDVILLKEHLSYIQITGVVLIIGGVLALELGKSG